MGPNATAVVRTALRGSGIELVASCAIETYDARAPEAFRSEALMPGARGLVVVGSAGPALWRRLQAQMRARCASWDDHPLDRFVATILSRAEAALEEAHVRFVRFEAAFHATPRVDFVAMARLVGLGSPGPFGMLIHAEHGAWWALRGAWLVNAAVEEPLEHRPPCAGCAAPCVGGWVNGDATSTRSGDIADASLENRSRCVVGQHSRYDDDQIAYHHDRAATRARPRGA